MKRMGGGGSVGVMLFSPQQTLGPHWAERIEMSGKSGGQGISPETNGLCCS